MTSFKYVLIGLSLLFCCGSADHQEKKTPPTSPQYLFENEAICGAPIEDACFESPEDKSFYLLGQAEKSVLSAVQIDLKLENEIGEMFYEDCDFQFVNDSRTRKLRNMLDRMRPYFDRREIDYQIFLIKDDQINAWTIPGGYIYVTTGIYEYVESDDELANIIGHEIGHNECKHTHKMLQRRALAEFPLQFLGVEADPSIFVGILSAAVASFGQHEELEADRHGFKLAAKTGYSPETGLDFWRRLAQRESPNFIEKFFRSHPYSENRYSCGMNYLEQHRIDD